MQQNLEMPVKKSQVQTEKADKHIPCEYLTLLQKLNMVVHVVGFAKSCIE